MVALLVSSSPSSSSWWWTVVTGQVSWFDKQGRPQAIVTSLLSSSPSSSSILSSSSSSWWQRSSQLVWQTDTASGAALTWHQHLLNFPHRHHDEEEEDRYDDDGDDDDFMVWSTGVSWESVPKPIGNKKINRWVLVTGKTTFMLIVRMLILEAQVVFNCYDDAYFHDYVMKYALIKWFHCCRADQVTLSFFR